MGSMKSRVASVIVDAAEKRAGARERGGVSGEAMTHRGTSMLGVVFFCDEFISRHRKNSAGYKDIRTQ